MGIGENVMFGSLKMVYETVKSVANGSLKVNLVSGMGIKSVTNDAIELGVGLLVVALIVPIALTQLFDVNTDTWDTQTVAVWVILPTIGILALGLKFFKQLRSGRR